MSAWHALFDVARPAFAQQRTFDRARGFALSALAVWAGAPVRVAVRLRAAVSRLVRSVSPV